MVSCLDHVFAWHGRSVYITSYDIPEARYRFRGFGPATSTLHKPNILGASRGLYSYLDTVSASQPLVTEHYLVSLCRGNPALLTPPEYIWSPPPPREHARRAMTSNSTRRSFGGKPLQTHQTHSRSSSSNTSPQAQTPSESNSPSSPSVDMSLRANGRATVNGIRDDMERAQINGRKRQSSPLMPAFMVSAPGKVIVFGEHAVVHGKVTPSVSSSL